MLTRPMTYPGSTPFQGLPAGLAFLRRRIRPIATGALIGTALGALYLTLATSQFTSIAILNIDSSRANPTGDAPMASDWQSQSAYIDSQVALLQSPATLRGVVAQMDLTHDPRFASQGSWLPGRGAPSPAKAEAQAETKLSHMLAVVRAGATSVVNVQVTSTDPALSAKIANAVTKAYMAQQVQAVSDTTAQAGIWMQNRIGELSQQALAADLAVQAYKARHNIVDVSSGAGVGMMAEQQLGELNTSLAAARARLAAAQARYAQAQNTTLTAPELGQNANAQPDPVMSQLQQQYFAAKRLEADLVSRLGRYHEAVIQQNKVVQELQQSLQAEIASQTQSDRADVAAANAEVASIQLQLNTEIASETTTNMQLSQLRALQSSADAYRSIYQNFLQRFTQATQDQSYPIPTARVAATAVAPVQRSAPHGKVTLMLGLILGLAAGFAYAVLQEALDLTIRSAAQLRAITGLDCLGTMAESVTLSCPATPARNTKSGQIYVPSAFRDAIMRPAGGMADAVQNVRVAAARRSNVKIIGCVASAPQEGCSTFAANLAFTLAADDQRTALVDWNAGAPFLTRILEPGAHAGLHELIAGRASLHEAAVSDIQSRLNFIGQTVAGAHGMRPGPQKIQALFASLRENFDAIILDLPPLQADNAAMQLSDWVDGYVLVTRWGATTQDSLAEIVALPACQEARFLGAVLNRCNPQRMKMYAGDTARTAVQRAPLPVFAEV
jgi:succinoglycan biosynthesis transport protein ExoP